MTSYYLTNQLTYALTTPFEAEQRNRTLIIVLGIMLMLSGLWSCKAATRAGVTQKTSNASAPTENPLKTLFKESSAGNWPFVEGLAKGIAAPIGKKNNYSPYGEWYYGLALYKRTKPEDAYLHFLHAYQNADDELNKAELQLWCAQSAMTSGFYHKAYTHQIGVVKPDLVSWADNIKAELVRMASIDTLASLRSSYPDDRALAYAIVKRMMQPKARKDWETIAQQLITQYQFKDLAVPIHQEGDELNAIVLLPIGINKFDVRQTPRPNQAWLDLYEGLALAKLHLADSGVKLNLHFYDIKKAFGWQDYLLTMNEFVGADLIIGPVIGQGSAQIAAYAQSNRIPMLNPLTNRVYWDTNNQYAWLSEPDANQVGALLAAQATQILPTKKVAIIYGPSEQDSTIATDYKDVMEGLGAKIVLFHKVGKNSAANLPKFLLKSGIDSTGHIFAPNDDDMVKVQLPSSMTILKIKAPVLTYGEWLNAPNANLQMYERLKFYLAETHFLSSIYPEVAAFNAAYAKKTHIWPSTIAAQGYEALMFFGVKTDLRVMSGTDFSSISQTGQLGGCYNYSKGNANSCIPIYRMKDLILERADR